MADTSRILGVRPDVRTLRVSLDEGVAGGLEALPTAAGVAMIEGPEGQTLLLTRTANIRKWAAQNLGAGPPPRRGQRPKTNLAGVATAVSCILAPTPFERTLVFERWMAPLVPYAKRKDLLPPVFLSLDAGERLARVSIVATAAPHVFGPFRNRKAAERASAALHKEYPLRPCDHGFEPHPELPLGRACLYAQVRSCSAPCLSRVSEDAYRSLAAEAVSALTSPEGRQGALALAVPITVGAAHGRGLVVSKVRGGAVLHPVVRGRVQDGVALTEEAMDEAVACLRWEAADTLPDDWAWLSTWLHSPAGRGSFVVVTESMDLVAAVRALLTAP